MLPDHSLLARTHRGSFKVDVHGDRAEISVAPASIALSGIALPLGRPLSNQVLQLQQQLEQRQQTAVPSPPTGDVRARVDAASWFRFPITWSTDPSSPPLVESAVAITHPLAAYTSDAAVSFRREIAVPEVDGTYTYTWDWQNGRGGSLSFLFVYEVSGGGTLATLTRSTNGGPSSTAYQGPPLSSLTLNLGLLLQAGNLSELDDQTLEQFLIGTWTVNENLNGSEAEVGRFDLRLLTLKNTVALPASFDPTLPVEDVRSSSTLRSEVFALPVQTELFPGGWAPTEPLAWRVAIGDADFQLVKTLTGNMQVTTPDANGKLGEISAVWKGEQDGSTSIASSGSYPFDVIAAGSVGVGNARTGVGFGNVAIGNKQVRTENVIASPAIFDPEADEKTTIRADIVTEGFENPEIEWELEVVSGDQVVRTFSGSANGSSVSIEQVWDGKDEGQNLVANGEYSYRLDARACEIVSSSSDASLRALDEHQHQHKAADGHDECRFADRFTGQLLVFKPILQVILSPDSILPSYLNMPDSGASSTNVTIKFNGIPPMNGRPQVDRVRVLLENDSVADSGGHHHNQPPRPGGSLPVSSKTLSKGERFSTTFTAPETGGIHQIKATIEGREDLVAIGAVTVRVPGLILFPATFGSGAPAYELVGKTPQHPNNHYGTPAFVLQLISVALENQRTDPVDATKRDTQRIVYYNDTSLPFGGLFDIGPPEHQFWRPSHFEHRRGNIVDMTPGDRVLRFTLENYQGGIYDEGNHWHVRF